MKILGELFKIFDRFKRPILLFSNKSQNHSTKMGVMVSFSIYGFLIYYLVMSDMITRKNAKITDQSVESSFRPEITLDNMVFDLSDDESVSYIDPTIFSFQGYIRYLKVNEITKNGFEYIYDMEEELRPCREDDFETGIYEKMGFHNKFCFNNKNLTVKGYWDEKEIKYVWIKLLRCVNNSDTNKTCKSDEEIDKYFYKKFFNIYFLNPYFDLNDYNNPVKSLWRNEYQASDPNTQKTFNLFFKKVEFVDDKNFPFVHSTVYESYSFEKRENDLFIETRTPVVFETLLYASIIVQRKVRIYQGLPDVLANIGGLFGILLFIGFIITEPEFRLNVIMGLFSERLSFNKPAKGYTDEYPEHFKLNEKSDFSSTITGIKSPHRKIQHTNTNKEFQNSSEEEIIRRKKCMSPYVSPRPDYSEGQIIFQIDDEPPCRNIPVDSRTEAVGEQPKMMDAEEGVVKIEKGSIVDSEEARGDMDEKWKTEIKKGERKDSLRENEVHGGSQNSIERGGDNNNNYHAISNFNSKDVSFSDVREKKQAHKGSEGIFPFSIFEYFVYEIKNIFNLKLTKKEQFFQKLENKYMEDLNVGIILQRIFLLESKTEAILSGQSSSPLPSNNLRPTSAKSLLQKKYTVYDLVDD